MNKSIFISNIKIKELPISLKNKYQLEIKLFDLDDNETSFLTSLMQENEIAEYKKNLFKVLNVVSELQAVHNPEIKTLSLILDENNKIAGLEVEKGIILKNEIKFL